MMLEAGTTTIQSAQDSPFCGDVTKLLESEQEGHTTAYILSATMSVSVKTDISAANMYRNPANLHRACFLHTSVYWMYLSLKKEILR